ncbi:hypothetical protein Tco_1372479, partial [Tanacetum coccineum]
VSLLPSDILWFLVARKSSFIPCKLGKRLKTAYQLPPLLLCAISPMTPPVTYALWPRSVTLRSNVYEQKNQSTKHLYAQDPKLSSQRRHIPQKFVSKSICGQQHKVQTNNKQKYTLQKEYDERLDNNNAQEVKPRNRPTQIETIENVHKGQKGKGEWRDSKEEKEALDICENIKEKVV